jgi:hypothetical protein
MQHERTSGPGSMSRVVCTDSDAMSRCETLPAWPWIRLATAGSHLTVILVYLLVRAPPHVTSRAATRAVVTTCAHVPRRASVVASLLAGGRERMAPLEEAPLEKAPLEKVSSARPLRRRRRPGATLVAPGVQAPVEAYASAVADAVGAADGAVLGASRPGDRVLLGAVAARLQAAVLTEASSVSAEQDRLVVTLTTYGGIAEEAVVVAGPVAAARAHANLLAPSRASVSEPRQPAGVCVERGPSLVDERASPRCAALPWRPCDPSQQHRVTPDIIVHLRFQTAV